MTEVTARRFRLASATTAVILGALTLVLAVLYVPLAWPARHVSDGWQVPLFVAVCLTGVVVARRQPGNPIGWILIGLGVFATFYTDAGRYAVFDYHFHRGDLPFGPAAVLVASGLWTFVFLATRRVIRWWLDRERLAAVTAAVAPGIPVIDARNDLGRRIEGPGQRQDRQPGAV